MIKASTSPKRSPREDLKLIQTFSSGQPHVDQARRFLDWFGWEPSTTTARCPRTIAGKRCRSYHYAQPCICQRLHYPLLDHPRIWRTADGERILTAEPYDFDGEDLAELVTECTTLGLRVRVIGTSPYFPGRTCLITIRKAATTDVHVEVRPAADERPSPHDSHNCQEARCADSDC